MIATPAMQVRLDAEVEALGAYVASRVRKPVPVRPSAWVRTNIKLSKNLSPSRPGWMDPDFKPWTAAVLDWRWDHPGAMGMVVVKRASIGLSTAIMALMLKHAAESGGPMLYMNADKESATFWSKEFLDEVLRENPRLAELFDSAVDDDDRRSTMITRPFKGGRIDFTGGGSASGVIGKPFLIVGVDEIDTIEDNFPKAAGSPWKFARARTNSVTDQAYLFCFSHPRTKRAGVGKIFTEDCNHWAWVFDCPHPECGKTINPEWSLVRYVTRANGEMGAHELAAALQTGEVQTAAFGGGSGMGVDARMARLHCPHCEGIITEEQRRRIVWPARLGGGGVGGSS